MRKSAVTEKVAAVCLFRIFIPNVINLVTRSKLSTNRLESSMGSPTTTGETVSPVFICGGRPQP